eukprot:scaffold250956_cov35-Tisochrysis_lutea.AAC.1
MAIWILLLFPEVQLSTVKRPLSSSSSHLSFDDKVVPPDDARIRIEYMDHARIVSARDKPNVRRDEITIQS